MTRLAMLLLVLLPVARSVAAQAEPTVEALLADARGAARDGDDAAAVTLLERAAARPFPDGRASAALAALASRQGRWEDAALLAQRAFLRATMSWAPGSARVRATALVALGEAREHGGDVAGALGAYLESLAHRASTSVRQRVRRLERMAEQDGSLAEAIAGYRSTWAGRAGPGAPCDAFVHDAADREGSAAEEGDSICEVVEGLRARSPWRLVRIGQRPSFALQLYVGRDGIWFDAGTLGEQFEGADSTDVVVRGRGIHRWDGRSWIVADVESWHWENGRCEDEESVRYATVACSLHEQEVQCVEWHRGWRRHRGPGHGYRRPEEGGAEGLDGCPPRPDTASPPSPPGPTPAQLRLGRRGIRLVGGELPTRLARWQTPLEAAREAAVVPNYWERGPGNVARIDWDRAELPPPPAPRPATPPEGDIRPDIAEFLQPRNTMP